MSKESIPFLFYIVKILYIPFITGCFFRIVENHVCLLKQKPDSSANGVLKWSMSYKERCHCQKVYTVTDISPYTSCSQNTIKRLLFVDSHEDLTSPENWNVEALNRLLNRTICQGML